MPYIRSIDKPEYKIGKKIQFREYNADKDVQAVRRIWYECGWIKNIDSDGFYVKDYFDAADHALVALIDGEAECAVQSNNGSIQFLDSKLKLGAITGVTTSRIARKLGFARELSAQLVARQAEAGLALSALGMFEQGFYDQIGFGSGSYEQSIKFDPASLNLGPPRRPPIRLTIKDADKMHQAMCKRSSPHGSVTLNSSLFFRSEIKTTEDGFGLGFSDFEDGELSHFIWGKYEAEHGPFLITFIAFQSSMQFMELMSLIKSLGDQINQVIMEEPGQFQIQDLLRQPFRSRRGSAKGKFSHESKSRAYWQIRILDLEACLAKTTLNTPPLSFNLVLNDPIEKSLPSDASWRGIGGKYIIQLGAISSAKPGQDEKLMTLTASVNAFSRLWLGVRPASSLAVTADLHGEPDLLKLLDASLRLPSPHPGWDF